MTRFVVMMASLVLAGAGIACGDVGGATAAREETSAQVVVSQVVLADAREAAARYAKEHLGHYRKLAERDLWVNGFQAPDGVSAAVKADHTSYCIRVTNRALPSIHPWRVGTVGSGNGEGSSADDCRK